MWKGCSELLKVPAGSPHRFRWFLCSAATLFRFPLRTPDQARTSELSGSAWDCAKMDRLLRDFATKDAAASLLFLTTVTCISIFEWLEGAAAPVLLFEAAANGTAGGTISGAADGLLRRADFIGSFGRPVGDSSTISEGAGPGPDGNGRLFGNKPDGFGGASHDIQRASDAFGQFPDAHERFLDAGPPSGHSADAPFRSDFPVDGNGLRMLDFTVEISVRPFRCPVNDPPVVTRWLVCNSLGTGGKVADYSDPGKGNKLLPLAGVAGRIDGGGSEGRAFCCLPLPIQTGLLVEVC